MIIDFPIELRITYDSVATPKTALRRYYESPAIKFSLGGRGQILNTFKIWPRFLGSSRVAGLSYDRPPTELGPSPIELRMSPTQNIGKSGRIVGTRVVVEYPY